MFKSIRAALSPSLGRDESERIHYLHIGKTAGNQIKFRCAQIEQHNPQLRFVMHSHAMTLRKIRDNQRYFFSIRQPLSRFTSAFYERKRQGRDGGNTWSADEALAFARYPHAVDLAEAIFDEGESGRTARAAMHSIGHLRKLHHEWFFPYGYFLEHRPPIWILRQENFEHDFARFVQELGVSPMQFQEADPALAKSTSYDKIPALTAKAKRNLSKWYEVDIRFYDDVSWWLDNR